MEKETIISWAVWIGLLTLTHLGYVWAENIAIFLVWVLAAIVFIIFLATVNAPLDKHKGLAVPFSLYAQIQVVAISFFFAMRGQFWTASAGMALLAFMVGIGGQIDRRREENNARVLRPGERGH